MFRLTIDFRILLELKIKKQQQQYNKRIHIYSNAAV